MTDDLAELDSLVPDAQRGDRVALRRLMQIIHPPVLRYCRARVGNQGLNTADDVAQEVLIAVVKSLPRYRDEGRPFIAFVYGIAGHKVADAHRLSARTLSEPTDELPENVDEQAGPLDRFLELESSNKVAKLLDGLSERAREIITLRVVAGLSAEDTAQIIGSTPGAVRVAQHRALNKLREALTETGSRAS